MVEFAYLMVVLSLNGNDTAISSSFVNTKTLKECQKRGEVVKTLLSQINTDVDVTCYPSNTIFEKFSHRKDAKKTDEYLYWLQIKQDQVAITLYTENKTCPKYNFTDIQALKTKGLCTVSSQKIIDNKAKVK